MKTIQLTAFLASVTLTGGLAAGDDTPSSAVKMVETDTRAPLPPRGAAIPSVSRTLDRVMPGSAGPSTSSSSNTTTTTTTTATTTTATPVVPSPAMPAPVTIPAPTTTIPAPSLPNIAIPTTVPSLHF
jgi:hypothetical protein